MNIFQHLLGSKPDPENEELERIVRQQLLAEELKMPIVDFTKNPYTNEFDADLDASVRRSASGNIEWTRACYFMDKYFECMHVAYRLRKPADESGPERTREEILLARRDFNALYSELEKHYSNTELTEIHTTYMDSNIVMPDRFTVE